MATWFGWLLGRLRAQLLLCWVQGQIEDHKDAVVATGIG